MKFHKVTYVLLVIGGLNWGLEAFDFGLSRFLGEDSSLLMVVYILVGLSALAEIFWHKKLCRNCAPQGGAM